MYSGFLRKYVRGSFTKKLRRYGAKKLGQFLKKTHIVNQTKLLGILHERITIKTLACFLWRSNHELKWDSEENLSLLNS